MPSRRLHGESRTRGTRHLPTRIRRALDGCGIDPVQGADPGRRLRGRPPVAGRHRQPAAAGPGVHDRLARRGGRRRGRAGGGRRDRATTSPPSCGCSAAAACRGSCCWSPASTTRACSRRPRPACRASSAAARRRPATWPAAIRSAAAGEGTLPPDLLGRLLRQVGQLQRQVLSPRGLTFSGLTERETAVLRLLAEGHRHGRGGAPALLLRADGQEHHPRHHVAPRAPEPGPRGGVRDPRGADLASLRGRSRPDIRQGTGRSPRHTPTDRLMRRCAHQTRRRRGLGGLRTGFSVPGRLGGQEGG